MNAKEDMRELDAAHETEDIRTILRGLVSRCGARHAALVPGL